MNRERIDFLVGLLNKANHDYYVKNEQIMSDNEFDMLLKELQYLERTTGYVSVDSPTHRVGSDLQTGWSDVSRTKMMGSIENTYTIDGVIEWRNSIDPEHKHRISIECKHDGLSLSLIYKNGVMVSASTRGNGYVGCDVTNNAKTIKNIPLFIKEWDALDEIEVRGEVLMKKSVLVEINKLRTLEGLPLFSNERNAASGSLKQLDTSVTASRNLIFVPYTAYNVPNTFTQTDTFQLLNEIGFYKSMNKSVVSDDEIIAGIEEIKDYISKIDYCCDGIVLKIEDFEYQTELDESGRKCPKWCTAYKWANDTVSTKLISVDWQVGRTGVLTPVGILEPVSLGGSIISKVTLNNINYIHELNIQIGSYILIQRGGAVIPKCVGVDYERNIQENIEIMSYS